VISEIQTRMHKIVEQKGLKVTTLTTCVGIKRRGGKETEKSGPIMGGGGGDE